MEVPFGEDLAINRSIVTDPTCSEASDWEGSDIEVHDINAWLTSVERGNFRLEDLKMVYVENSQDSLILSDSFQTQLIAGQHIDAGDVTVTLDENGNIVATYTTVRDWFIEEIHLSIVEGDNFRPDPTEDYDCPDDFPQTRKGSPKIGHFEFQESYRDPVTESVVETGVSFDINKTFFIAAHAVVVRKDETGQFVQEETAWGEGLPFDKSWAMYFLVDFDLITVEDPQNFAMSRFEITQLSGDWWHLYGFDSLLQNQPHGRSSKYPVHNMTWKEAAQFCNDLTRALIEKGANLEVVYEEVDGEITGNADFSKYGFHLPTEAQWKAALESGLADEYASSGSSYYRNDNSTGEEGKVIFSMYGNASEWLDDWADQGQETKVIAGGNVFDEEISAGHINERFHNVGFRVVIDIKPDWELAKQ